MKWLDSKTVERVALRALASNGQILSRSCRKIEWDISGKCQAPVMVELTGRPLKKDGPYVLPERGRPIWILMWTKCRRCSACLHARRLLWQDRGRWEYAASSRTWLVTLTYNPDWHARDLAVARQALAKQGLDYDALDADDQFRVRAREMGHELTRYLKRLRKNSGVSFRYLAVTEKHQNGLPHLHVLLHEQSMNGPLRKRLIQAAWARGFTNAKLVSDVRQAVYVTKYLSKSRDARVRASLRYGSERNEVSIEPAASAMTTTKGGGRASTPKGETCGEERTKESKPLHLEGVTGETKGVSPPPIGVYSGREFTAEGKSDDDKSTRTSPEGLDFQPLAGGNRPRAEGPGDHPPLTLAEKAKSYAARAAEAALQQEILGRARRLRTEECEALGESPRD